ncbi:sulfate transporter [Haloarcula hispanica N601]|uniref:Sulfate transporter n=1 Tax=Haloarcula hispanica N601 TaxID=1417673 RepID=V5TLR0_HALHI|nr:putative sulfate/molybdate transporter [Haloarcula hispanica]AHB66266.1 sulfate transporter [Haloarcula hispanica N601]
MSLPLRDRTAISLSWNELTGAVGDSATVLPVVVAVAVLTELSLPVMLVWFGVFQVVWGLYYGVPISVEPMKAFAALVIAGTISTGELVVAGLLLAGILLALGTTRSLETVNQYVDDTVVRGVQLGVALVLLETGVDLGLSDPTLLVVAVGLVALFALLGNSGQSAFAVFVLGVVLALAETGVPTPAVPAVDAMFMLPRMTLSVQTAEAVLAQIAVTVGNAALATSVLLADYFDRDVSADQLSNSMGLMNLAAVPFGAFPMCHGSGGVAGKYAFGARTPGANLLLGAGYVLTAFLAVGVIAAYPTALLGVILVLIALQLGWTGVSKTDDLAVVAAIGVLGVLVNLGLAFVVGVLVQQLRTQL